MPTEWKVWLHVEKVNEDRDIYEDTNSPDLLGTFKRREQAENFVRKLVDAQFNDQGD